ncbi:MAG: signal recognition particle protein [Bacteroidetes bacterium]|nr:signal recognition particle protein [Bacteroidota bacterium]
MFEDLSSKFESVFKKIRGESRITELNISDSMRDIRRALLEADVNIQVAREFTEKVKVKALGADVLKSVSPGQQIVKHVYDELVDLLGGSNVGIQYSTKLPSVILVCGLQGSGKTTFCGKLANQLKKQGKVPAIVAADIYRPAAIDQLKKLGAQISVPVLSYDVKDAVEVARRGVEDSRLAGRGVVIIDTAGRLHVDSEMMDEVRRIKEAVGPAETLFVVDAMTGQDAVNTAKAFWDSVAFSGIVMTKMDGDTRGGAALSIRHVVGQPIKFLSYGEKLESLDLFYPERLAQRILGMGDVVSLVEKAQEAISVDDAKKLHDKIRKNDFNLEDFLSQLQQIKKLGSMSSILGMLPGIGKAIKDMPVDDQATKKVEAIILSMTFKERRNPDLLNGSRRLRIAKGSGTSVQEVNRLMKQFYDMKKMMKNMSKLGKGAMANPAMMKKLLR